MTKPTKPEPDGYLTLMLAGREVEVNAFRDSTMEAYAEEYAQFAVLEALSTPRWQPMHTAPTDGTEVLLSVDGLVELGHYDSDKHAKHPKPYWTTSATRARGVMWSRRNPPIAWQPKPPPAMNAFWSPPVVSVEV